MTTTNNSSNLGNGAEDNAHEDRVSLSAAHHKLAVHLPFQNHGMFDAGTLTRTFRISSVIIDKYAGLTLTEPIWSGAAVNSAYVSREIMHEDVFASVVRFFQTRAIGRVIERMVSTPTLRLGGFVSTIYDCIAAVREVADERSTNAIVELITPALVRNQIMLDPHKAFPIMRRYTERFTMSPSVDDIVQELARLEIERSVRECTSAWTLEAGKTYSVKAIAIDAGEAFYTLARRLSTAFDFKPIVRDIIRAIRVRLDPTADGLLGDMPREFVEHEVVDVLSTNWTFVSEALLDPTDQISPVTDLFRFMNNAPIVLATLKTSDRYSLRAKSELLAPWGLMHVEDERGVRRASILYENAVMDPVALSVVAFDHPLGGGAVNVARSVGRIDSHIAAAYGALPQTMTVANAARMLQTVLQHNLESGVERCAGLYVVGTKTSNVSDIATLIAGDICYAPGDVQNYVFRLPTSAKFPDGLGSGVEERGIVFTSDAAEALLAADAFEPSRQADILPQLLPKAAMDSLLFVTNQDDLVRTTARYTFNRSIGHAVLRGTLRWAELETSRADVAATMVRPVFNAMVYDVIRETFELTQRVVKHSPGLIQRQLKRYVAHELLSIAQSVAPAFRLGVHNLMVSRSLSKTSQAELRLAKARLNSSAVKAYTDLFAAAFFFAIQGIGHLQQVHHTPIADAENVDADVDTIVESASKGIDALFSIAWTDAVMAESLMEFGSNK